MGASFDCSSALDQLPISVQSCLGSPRLGNKGRLPKEEVFFCMGLFFYEFNLWTISFENIYYSNGSMGIFS